MAPFVLSVNERNQATELRLLKVWGGAAANPHMRAWWGATLSFFLAFFGWFAFTGLETPFVAESLGICENQLYPPEDFPKRVAFLKFKDLNTMDTYCQYGKLTPPGAANPTDCKPVPADVAAKALCSAVVTTNCSTASQMRKYRPEVLAKARCVCGAGTECKTRLTDAGTAAVSSTIATRVFLGTLLELYGPVNVQCGLMVFGAIWVGAGALVSNVASYIAIRFFIGMVGASFVTNQLWNTVMFAPNVVGAANGVSAGWGNLGGGVTTAFMPSVLVEPQVHAGMDPNLAWRLAMLFPMILMLATAIGMKLLCWDAPTSRRLQFADLGKGKAAGWRDYCRVLRDPRIVVMAMQYGACFGTELTMYNQLPKHFSQYFQMQAAKASAMASIFGLTNIFSRPLGGILSDVAFRYGGVRGRVWLHFAVLFLEAVFLYGFGNIDTSQPVEAAAIVLFIFSIFCEMGCGTSYGIVPFMTNEKAVVSAIVGAGGNLGAVISAQAFYRPIADDLIPYQAHAAYVMFWALLTPIYYWPEHGGMFCRARAQEPQEESQPKGGNANEAVTASPESEKKVVANAEVAV